MSNLKGKKLYRNKSDKIIGGIFGGLGEYLDVDSNFLRVIGLIIFVFTGFIPVAAIYFITMLVLPRKEEKEDEKKT